MDIIFLVENQAFKQFDSSIVHIYGLSAKFSNSYEVVVGSNNPVMLEITFWTKKEDDFIIQDVKVGAFHKKYAIPNVGDVDILSGLMSSVKGTIYDMANILAQNYEYQLKAIEEQLFLNKEFE